MRNIPLKSVDNIARDVIALATDYLPDTLLEYHAHRRAQFLYPATGLIEVSTTDGEWVIPPSCGVWIPEQVAHETRMLNVSTRSLYIEPAARPRHAVSCEVVSVSPLLRQLLLEAVDSPAEYDIQGRDGVLMQLILCELARMPRCRFSRRSRVMRSSVVCAVSLCVNRLSPHNRGNGRNSCTKASALSAVFSAPRPGCHFQNGGSRRVF